jgi:two-component system, NtrC family, nitrogen regulation sensor histidine kinase NtrY
MKITKYIKTPLLLFIVFLIAGIVAESYVISGGIRNNDIKRFTRVLHRKLNKVDQLMNKVASKLDGLENESIEVVFDALKVSNELFEEKEISLMVTRNGELVYWSDHVVGFYNEIVNSDEGFVQLPNGWFVLTRISHNDYVIHGVTLIKYNYQIQNDYLKNGFAKGFHFPGDFEIHFYKSDPAYPIYDNQGSFLFSIEPSGNLPCLYADLYFPVALFVLALLFLFMFLYRYFIHHFHKYKELKLIVLLLLLVGLYLGLGYSRFPKSVFLLDLFTPKFFAWSSLWKSLGEFLFFSLILFFWGIVFARSFDIAEKLKRKALLRRLSLAVWMVQIALYFVFIRFMVHTLLMNSSVSFSIYRIEEISFYSIVGFLAIGFLFLAFFFVAFRTTQVFRKVTPYREFFIILAFVTLVIALLFPAIDSEGQLRLNLFYAFIMGAAFWANKGNMVKHRLSLVVVFVLIFTLFSINTLFKFQVESERKIQELMAINLSVEHDPMAELFLRDIDFQIKNDKVLDGLLVPPYDSAKEYVARKYFGGYLRGDYELQFTICHSHDSVMVQPGNIVQPCLMFFESMIEDAGVEIPGIGFSFLDNMNGRITYLGQYPFPPNEYRQGCTMFIELNSKLQSEGTGFPELLLPANSFENRLKQNFSFAKYNHGALVDRGGDYLYALTARSYLMPESNPGFVKWDGYEHCIYSMNDNSFVVVSRKDVRFYDLLISFPYIFVFLFLLSAIINFTTKPYLNLSPIKGSLRYRIQISIVGVVFVALLIVGSGTILYNVAQYRSKHRQDLIDKINSVSVEIDMFMRNNDDDADGFTDYLYYELLRISDVFWTDVNIYNLRGELIASSRPEVFEKGLISPQMDNTAIFHLNKYEPTRFLHREHIAKMEYLSAYVPLINGAGQNIGYINIPYFTKEREFRKEITTFILAFINIYVFLLLVSVMVAYYIASRITLPLKLIRENLRGVQLGKETKPITYRSDDEIGLLVSEYNNKLEELANSAELLARSERETAWREMARQIAHEIKNPLTPMKLNIQFLQRVKPGEMDNYEEMVKRVTETLIEQIDNLSSIATEFSNFAQMPRARNEQFNLAERLFEIIKLYNYTGQIAIATHFKGCEKLMVYADKEQFSRAILNLIKNSIQAIPENKTGNIDLRLSKSKASRTVVIEVQDNGKGIPETLKERIFVPNFTTKSSGTGLGLAITKNIVENFKGEIWFESEAEKGTSFFIQMPILSDK